MNDLPTAAAMVYTALHYTFGRVIEEQDSPTISGAEEELPATFTDHYPTVARAIQQAQRDGYTMADAFDAGLTLILGETAALDRGDQNRGKPV